MSEAEEEYDYQREPEPDQRTIHMNSNRSRYFFAMMSFLVALLFLSVYLIESQSQYWYKLSNHQKLNKHDRYSR